MLSYNGNIITLLTIIVIFEVKTAGVQYYYISGFRRGIYPYYSFVILQYNLSIQKSFIVIFCVLITVPITFCINEYMCCDNNLVDFIVHIDGI